MRYPASVPPSTSRLPGFVAWGALLLGLGRCGGIAVPQPLAASDEGTGGTATGDTLAGAGGAIASGGSGGTTSTAEFGLLGAPLIFDPTADGFGLNAVTAVGDAGALRARLRALGTAVWGELAPPTVRGTDVAQWVFSGLSPGIRYEYEILVPGATDDTTLYAGSAITQRPPGEAFTFALITDSHIGANLRYTNQGDPNVLAAVSTEVSAAAPDFIVHLGDMLDFHEYGFNDPPPTGSVTRSAYLNYRSLLGHSIGHAAHFPTIGNWEGENGTYTAEEIARSMQQRWLYLPAPGPATYPEGGSPNQDYYAFTWGDALFIVLNVMTYTTTEHLLGTYPGLPDDWTLGAEQLAWLRDTLANATAKWRFLHIHHPVGGEAGNEVNSAYGRGGGRAAYVGEQAEVHQLMLQYGAQIFFYGHDHVFTDMTVDGIHYTLPGDAGAIWRFSPYETGYEQSWLEYGWTRVDVSPERVHVQFIKMGDGILYEYTLP
jgi:3',5'-cyclic AMP phosphodiesterase CpdA